MAVTIRSGTRKRVVAREIIRGESGGSCVNRGAGRGDQGGAARIILLIILLQRPQRTQTVVC